MKFVLFVPIVPSGSMEPTIAEHSALIALRVHHLEKLQRGDIVVFTAQTPELEGTTLIKRLIGLPGDHVEIDESGAVTINGEVQPEDYVVYQYAIPGEYDVPEGYRPGDVVMDGGRLHVRWAEDDHVMLSGPAEFVFDGEITL